MSEDIVWENTTSNYEVILERDELVEPGRGWTLSFTSINGHHRKSILIPLDRKHIKDLGQAIILELGG